MFELFNPVTSAVMGPWLERNGPKKGALIGGTLFFIGHLISALGVYVDKLPVIFIGHGVFAACGLGLTYISPVSPLQKWFPEMRGFAAGLAVCGYGAGSVMAPYAQKFMIGADYAKTGVANLGVALTFVILGSVYFVIITAGAMVLRMPPPGYEIKGVNIHTIKGAERKTCDKDAESTEGAAPQFDTSAHFAMSLSQSVLSKQYWMTVSVRFQEI